MAELVTMTKAELLVDADSEVASGGDAVLKVQITNQVKWLSTHYAFSDLDIRRELNLVPGTRYYDFPTHLVGAAVTQDFNLGLKLVAECYWSNLWYSVAPGIMLLNYNVLNPELNVRLDPVMRWQKYRPVASAVPQFEVWPLPATATRLRLSGQMFLPVLAADADVCELDDLLVCQWTAAKLLARMKSADAPAMLAEAQKTLQRLIGGDNSPSQVFSMGGGSRQRDRSERPTVAVNYTP